MVLVLPQSWEAGVYCLLNKCAPRTNVIYKGERHAFRKARFSSVWVASDPILYRSFVLWICRSGLDKSREVEKVLNGRRREFFRLRELFGGLRQPELPVPRKPWDGGGEKGSVFADEGLDRRRCPSVHFPEFVDDSGYASPWHLVCFGSELDVDRLGVLFLMCRARLVLDMAGSFRLLRVCEEKAGLLSAAALISTLGGGHFFCRHLSTARSLALAQATVLSRAEDFDGARRALLHLVYVEAQAGNISLALRHADHLTVMAKKADDPGLLPLLVHAREFAKLVQHARTRAPGPKDHNGDDFYRFRL